MFARAAYRGWNRKAIVDFGHGVMALLGMILMALGIGMVVTLILFPAGIVTAAIGMLMFMWGEDDVPREKMSIEETPLRPRLPVVFDRRISPRVGEEKTEREMEPAMADQE